VWVCGEGQTDRHTDTHRWPWPLYISHRLWLKWNVMMIEMMAWFSTSVMSAFALLLRWWEQHCVYRNCASISLEGFLMETCGNLSADQLNKNCQHCQWTVNQICSYIYQPLQRLFGAVGQLYVYDLWPRHLARWFVLTLVVGQGHWSKFLVTGEKNSGVKHFFGYACTLPGDSKARAVKNQNWIENSK